MLGLVKLRTLKTYIKASLANIFTKPFKFFKDALTFFEKNLMMVYYYT